MCFQRQVRRLEQISMEKKRIDEGQDMYEEVKKEETQSVSNEQKNEEEENKGGVSLEGLTEKEAREVKEILKRFLKAYQESGGEQERFEWLEKQLGIELPEKTTEEIREIKEEIVVSVREYDMDLRAMTREIENGRTKERWFADRIEEAAKGVAVNDYGNYLNQINQTMETANQQMLARILRQDGGINECVNLDGFIAEQYHVNNFNAKAALQKSNFRAEVCVPKQGEVYKRNSIDVRIWDTKAEKIIHQYQFKFGKDVQATKTLLADGDYHSQRYLVPAEQVQELKEAFPTKTVTDRLGGTNQVDIASDPLSKADVKKMQEEWQEKEILPRTDWNVYNTRELAINLGKQAGTAGMQAALITTGFSLAGRAMSGEEIEGSEVVETALVTGADAGVKAAAGGALTVASQNGVIPFLSKMSPGAITKIACVGIENVKILWKVVKGEMTFSEALEHMGRTSTAMYAGLSCGAAGAAVGAVALSFIPIVGPVVGGLVGGMVGYAAGSKVGEAVFNGVKKVAEKGKELVERAWEGVKNIGASIVDGICSFFSL